MLGYVALVLLLVPAYVAAQESILAHADSAWARRAEGHSNHRAAPGPIMAAIASYEEALREQPRNLEARWKLLRALQFLGQFATDVREERREVFDRGRQAFEVGQDLLAERVGGRDELDAMSPDQMQASFGGTPEVVPLYLHGAINYGLWARAFGAVAAVRQGVGTRIRRYAQIVIALDPEYQGGAGQRLLAGIHSNAPRIPFLTRWVKREKAIALLQEALEIDPEHRATRMSLAETLLKHAPDRETEARAILVELAELEPRLDALVETLDMQRRAQLLSGS